jgi:hypothetical protein
LKIARFLNTLRKPRVSSSLAPCSTGIENGQRVSMVPSKPKIAELALFDWLCSFRIPLHPKTKNPCTKMHKRAQQPMKITDRTQTNGGIAHPANGCGSPQHALRRRGAIPPTK